MGTEIVFSNTFEDFDNSNFNIKFSICEMVLFAFGCEKRGFAICLFGILIGMVFSNTEEL